MKKNDLIKAFSEVCYFMADNMDSVLLPQLDDEMTMGTPIFDAASITDIEEWWQWDDHLTQHLVILASWGEDAKQDFLRQGRKHLRDAGFEKQFDDYLLSIKSQNQISMQMFKKMPHVMLYDNVFNQSEGFVKLQTYCQRMEDVGVVPVVTVNKKVSNLEDAYCLSVSVVSFDGKPLKPKIQNRSRFIS